MSRTQSRVLLHLLWRSMQSSLSATRKGYTAMEVIIMSIDGAKSNKLKSRLYLLLYGMLFHLLLLRGIAHWEYPPPADRAFVDHLAVNITLAFLGGAAFVLALFPVLQRAARPERVNLFSLSGKGGLLGALATTLALQAEIILLTLYSLHSMRSAVPGLSIGSGFWIALIPIQTYGLVVMIECSPWAFMNGVLFAATVRWFSRRSSNPPRVIASP